MSIMFERKKTEQISVGGVKIGALAPVSVQSMCNTKTHDVTATVGQIKRLRAAGCEIVRLAIPDMAAAEAIPEIKKQTDMPLVADIHFDYRLALAVAERGIDKIRINPGNIGSEENVRKVAAACRERGSLLSEGIGDTVRVALTADPVEEIKAAIAILKAAGLRRGIRLVSCPTCGRTNIDLISLANEVEKRISGIDKDITVAVMGCVVNGPGEAREADYGIAGGKDCGLLFKHGEVLGTYPYDRLCDALIDLIEKDS